MKQDLSLKEVGKDKWFFSYPSGYHKAQEYFMSGLEELDSGDTRKAVVKFKLALALFPQHIDALHHLSLLTEDVAETRRLNETAVEIGLSAFPKKFDLQKSKLEWGWIENRPFLRSYESKALHLLENNPDEALKMFLQLLSWNPNDNQGVREIVADIYIQELRWDEMLSLAKKYSSDSNPSIGYGEALAHYKKGDTEKATTKLKSCIKHLPLCAKMLLERTPKQPKSAMPGYITVGGADQAYEFWKSQGKAKSWQEEDVKKWLKDNIN